MSKRPYSIQEFQHITLIGKGTYAKVFLSKRKCDGEVFAIKVLKKKYIIEKNQQQHIMTQKQILKGINHPFLVKMIANFQDQKKLYFVLQYCAGGQLFQYLSIQDKLTQSHLKPQNIIIDKNGYVKLTDFGLSKILQDQSQKAQTICGTPQYLAPQVIRKQGHGIQVDWWCLGCLIHEMMTGFPPFRSQNRMKLFQQIIYQEPNLKKFDPVLQDLLKRLLNKDPYKRLGSKGGKQIMSHPWFKNIQWDLMLQKKLKAPYIPDVTSQTDTQNFHTDFTNCKIESYQQSPIDANIQDKFQGFDI